MPNEEFEKSMQMLYSAKWNVPQAAEHCGLSWDSCKAHFIEYCQSRELTQTTQDYT